LSHIVTSTPTTTENGRGKLGKGPSADTGSAGRVCGRNNDAGLGVNHGTQRNDKRFRLNLFANCSHETAKIIARPDSIDARNDSGDRTRRCGLCKQSGNLLAKHATFEL
jgi:hypothetical protein